ncbi:uncharacterized protein LOC120838719 [Ixodes scapularis]|uniref:uncharacterized protein LOC120838719 n=1 Tax=Ixodes scapularis TaxID=6945 RepID=UPI001C38DDFB|nr:uncharacterized protein LOC120838719 [Ixodes scapularis]
MQSSNPFCFIVQILLCLCSAPVWASPFSQVIVTTTLATEGFPVFQDKSDARFGVLAYWPQYAFTRHKEATPSTSTLINEASKPWNVASSILLCLCSAPVWASPFSQVIVTTTLATEGFPVFQDKSDARFGVLAYWPQYAFTRHKEATPSTSTLINEASKPWNVASSVSGHGNSLRMQSSNPFCFIVQVGSSPSLHTRRTNNVVLLLFPCPSVICVTVIECYDVVKSLLALSGDIELNPGPMSDVQAKQFADLMRLLGKSTLTSMTSQDGKQLPINYPIIANFMKHEELRLKGVCLRTLWAHQHRDFVLSILVANTR